MNKLINLMVWDKKVVSFTFFFLLISLISFAQELENRAVLNGQVQLLLPVGFTLMNESALAIKYPNTANRPSEVYTNLEGSINIGFNHTQNTAMEKDLSSIKQVLLSQLSNSPGVEVKETNELQINDKKFVTLEFISKALDTKVYNLMFVTTLDNRLLLGSFNCTLENLDEWNSISGNIINSIKVK